LQKSSQEANTPPVLAKRLSLLQVKSRLGDLLIEDKKQPVAHTWHTLPERRLSEEGNMYIDNSVEMAWEKLNLGTEHSRNEPCIFTHWHLKVRGHGVGRRRGSRDAQVPWPDTK
jgi:hypothetical protein